MPCLPINNIEVYYEQHGAGPDLILLGGLSADHHVWKSALRLLSRHFRVLMMDNRGAGQSSTPDFPYTTELMANDVLQLMHVLHIDRADVIGHSMGGCIAQQLVLLAPHRVKKCVIASSRAKPNVIANMIFDTRKKLDNVGVSCDIIAEYMMPFLFSESFLSSSANVKGFIQWTLQNPSPQSAVGFAHQLHAVKIHNVYDRLHEIQNSVLVIAGEEDMLMPMKEAIALTKHLKNGSFVAISDCAHMPHVEKSAEFVQCVLQYLK